MGGFPATRGGAVCSITRWPLRFGLRPRGPVRKVEQNCAEADSDVERSEGVRSGAAGMLRAPPLAMNSRRWYALGVMLCAVFLAAFDFNVVTAAIHSIQPGLATTFSEIQLIVAGYALSFAVQIGRAHV